MATDRSMARARRDGAAGIRRGAVKKGVGFVRQLLPDRRRLEEIIVETDPDWKALAPDQQELERAGSVAGSGRMAPRTPRLPMTRPRVTRADHGVFERLGRADEAVRDEVPPPSMREVFDGMEAIRTALGRWSEPGLPPGGRAGDRRAAPDPGEIPREGTPWSVMPSATSVNASTRSRSTGLPSGSRQGVEAVLESLPVRTDPRLGPRVARSESLGLYGRGPGFDLRDQGSKAIVGAPLRTLAAGPFVRVVSPLREAEGGLRRLWALAGDRSRRLLGHSRPCVGMSDVLAQLHRQRFRSLVNSLGRLMQILAVADLERGRPVGKRDVHPQDVRVPGIGRDHRARFPAFDPPSPEPPLRHSTRTSRLRELAIDEVADQALCVCLGEILGNANHSGCADLCGSATDRSERQRARGDHTARLRSPVLRASRIVAATSGAFIGSPPSLPVRCSSSAASGRRLSGLRRQKARELVGSRHFLLLDFRVFFAYIAGCSRGGTGLGRDDIDDIADKDETGHGGCRELGPSQR